MNVIFVILIFIHFGSLLSVVCVTDTWSSYEKNGIVCYYCSPGYYWIGDCMVSNTQAQCKPCPEDHYQTSQNIAHYCSRCSSCHQIVRNFALAAEVVHCTSRSDTICGCIPQYHFVKDHGGMGVGFCYRNTKCSAGSGVLMQATNFTDTECMPCVERLTYSSSESYEPCMPCRMSCPNGTHTKSVCNATHDTECQQKYDAHIHERKTEALRSEDVVAIVSAIFLILIFLAVCGLRRRNQRRIRKNNAYKLREMQKGADMPIWIKNCIKDEQMSWPALFGECYKHLSRNWEAFVRCLFVLSGRPDEGGQVVNEVKERFDKEKFQERIYEACNRWKEKCHLENENDMIKIFIKAFKDHRSNSMKDVCCSCFWNIR